MDFHVIHCKWHGEYFIVYLPHRSSGGEAKWVLHVVSNVKDESKQKEREIKMQ